MDKPFFIMMYSQNRKFIMPITEGDDDDVALYATAKEAREVAQNHHAAQCFGFEIFSMEEGL